MPKGFSDVEKTRIRAVLLAQAQACLTRYGVRKTSVDDLVAAAGISKGAFYLFYPSKEELFITVLEQAEAAYHAELLVQIDATTGPPVARVRTFLHQAVHLWRENPLFGDFGQAEIAYLARKIAPERLAANQDRDEALAAALLERARAQALPLATTPAAFAGLLRTLFFVSLHAPDIGPAAPATLTLLIDLLAAHLVAVPAPPAEAAHA
jgi:AcrR family transcriptional regulator